MSLKFRDQTEEVGRRARSRTRETKPQGQAAPPLIKSGPDKPSSSKLASLEEEATIFFLKNFVIDPDHVVMSLESSLENSQSGPEKMVNDAVISVGLAGLASARHDASTMMLARSKFASALSLTIAAIQDPGLVKSSSTLKAVMLVAMFEVDIKSRDLKFPS